METKIFGNIIPILSEEEYENKQSDVWVRREKGDAIARLQVMYHVATHMTDKSGKVMLAFESMMLDGAENLPDSSVLNPALQEILSASDHSLSNADNASKNEKQAKFDSDPRYTSDGKIPNAVLVYANGGAALVHLNGFVDSDDLGEPLDCSRTDMVLNQVPQWSEKQFGIRLAGYVDSNGMLKGLDENDRIAAISGYDYIAGDCVLVGIDDKYNYLPLHPYDAVTVYNYFK